MYYTQDSEQFDHLLEAMDNEPLGGSDPLKRPERARQYARTTFGIPWAARLLYRPQPATARINSLGVRNSLSHDRSFRFFSRNAQGRFSELITAYLERNDRPDVQFLTHIDASIALGYRDRCTEAVWASVTLLLNLHSLYMDTKEELWLIPSKSGLQFSLRLQNCKTYAFVQRLFFYMGRYTGMNVTDIISMTEDRLNELRVGTFTITDELPMLEHQIYQAEDDAVEQFRRDDVKEWVGPMIPVEDVSTPIVDPAGVDCKTCYFQLTAPGVRTKPCGHAYCRECLEGWIHAAEQASHMCPYCRTELFPLPVYTSKDPEVRRNCKNTLKKLSMQLNEVAELRRSLYWCNKELVLQLEYERHIANGQNTE